MQYHIYRSSERTLVLDCRHRVNVSRFAKEPRRTRVYTACYSSSCPNSLFTNFWHFQQCVKLWQLVLLAVKTRLATASKLVPYAFEQWLPSVYTRMHVLRCNHQFRRRRRTRIKIPCRAINLLLCLLFSNASEIIVIKMTDSSDLNTSTVFFVRRNVPGNT